MTRTVSKVFPITVCCMRPLNEYDIETRYLENLPKGLRCGSEPEDACMTQH